MIVRWNHTWIVTIAIAITFTNHDWTWFNIEQRWYKKKSINIWKSQFNEKIFFYRKTIFRFNDKSIIIEKKSRKYTRKNDYYINRCSFIIEHRILYKQFTNKNFFMFEFISYLTRIIFFWDLKFIFSLEKWISRDFMNIIINDSLSRWHLKNIIERHKNEVTSSDCLKHSHKMRIRECHFTKQSFARIFDRYHSIRALEIFEARRLIAWRVKKSTFCQTIVLIDSSRVRMNFEKMSSVLKSLMKYWGQTWYHRVNRDRNNW